MSWETAACAAFNAEVSTTDELSSGQPGAAIDALAAAPVAARPARGPSFDNPVDHQPDATLAQRHAVETAFQVARAARGIAAG